jgi:hypothetical protein
MILTDFEKRIYNCYLKNFRSNLPYKPRKNFDDLDKNTLAFLNKISLFLRRYNHISVDEYFYAFKDLHPNEKYPPLSFFSSRLALKHYSVYKKKQEEQNPENQFDKIKEGFKFIGMFCLENKISLEKYIHHKTGYMISWLNHYREHRINPYCLMEIGNFLSVLDSLPKDEIALFAQNLDQNLISYKTRYNQSQKTKEYVKKLTNTIRDFVKKELTKS